MLYPSSVNYIAQYYVGTSMLSSNAYHGEDWTCEAIGTKEIAYVSLFFRDRRLMLEFTSSYDTDLLFAF